MARKKQSRGICSFCGEDIARGWMARHLAKCEQRMTANSAAKGKAQMLYHLRAIEAYGGDFWLDLEVRADATLEDLDHYLRYIWLECCGHLSMFGIERWQEELVMKAKIGTMFEQFEQLYHLYDFGSTSETLVQYLGKREGVPLSKNPIYLLGRNQNPTVSCMECEDSAEYLCIECLYENDEPGYLCAKHVESHPHDDYGPPVRLVNSPRVGVCGEITDDKPPY